MGDDDVEVRTVTSKYEEKYRRLWDGNVEGYQSHSEADLALLGRIVYWSGDPDQVFRIFQQSGLYRRERWGESWRDTIYGRNTIARAFAGRGEADFYTPRPERDEESEDGQPKARQAEKSRAPTLVQLALDAGVELFHTPIGVSYATIPVGEHRETWPVGSKTFERWLQWLFYTQQGLTLGSSALNDVLGVLEAKANFEGPEIPVHLRRAFHDGKIYIDLGDDQWQAVEIDDQDWRIITDPLVRFRRTKSMESLPAPVKGGSLDELRRFLNIHETDWSLLRGWLVGASYPDIPIPLVDLNGEQGSAKSTTTRALKKAIDPSSAPLRRPPKDESDLGVAANNSAVLAFDNLSGLSKDLSDALCTLATGGSFGGRKLYTDDEEAVFTVTRPVIVNGIGETASRSDLMDRTIFITLPKIPEEARRDETTYWGEFNEAWPRVFGGLLDSLSQALRNLPEMPHTGLPRMADFTRVAMAAEPEHERGTFLARYRENRNDAHSLALEGSSIAQVIRDLMSGRDAPWEGTPADLLNELTPKLSARSARIPKNPRALSVEIKRLASNLLNVGIEVTFGRTKTARGITISWGDARGDAKSVGVTHGVTQDSAPDGSTTPGDAFGDAGDAKIPTSSVGTMKKSPVEGGDEPTEEGNKRVEKFASPASFASSGPSIFDQMLDGTYRPSVAAHG